MRLKNVEAAAAELKRHHLTAQIHEVPSVMEDDSTYVVVREETSFLIPYFFSTGVSSVFTRGHDCLHLCH